MTGWAERSRDKRFERRKTPTRRSIAVFFVTPWLDEDRNRNDKWEATVTTNNRGQYRFVGVAKGEYHVDFFELEPGNKVRVHDTGRGR